MRQNNLYPFATAEGEYVPADILRPVGVISKSITSSGSSSAIAIPDGADSLLFQSSSAALVQFGMNDTITATALADGTLKADSVYIPANMICLISPPAGHTHFAVRAISAPGTLITQILESWNALSTASKYVRR